MQSIGMTGKQLRRLMVYEGIYYAYRCGHYRRSSRSDLGSHSAKERIEWPLQCGSLL